MARGTVRGHPYDPRCWLADVPAEHGHSGGALLDAHGRLIGLIQGKVEFTPVDDGDGCEHPAEVMTVAMKTAYVLPLLPAVVAGVARSTNSASRACRGSDPGPPTSANPPLAAAASAVVPIVTYGPSTPLMSPWDYS